MPDVYDLWSGLAALKTLPPFVIALPILIALVFASIADWLERRLSVPGGRIAGLGRRQNLVLADGPTPCPTRRPKP